MSAGRIVMEVHGTAAENNVRLPAEFTMVGKALLNLEAVTRTLDPKFDPSASIRRHAVGLLNRRLRQRSSSGNFYNALLETSEFAQRLPERLNRILDRISNNEFNISVDAIDEDQLIRGIQKIANRITMGLILVALIIGAALIMHVPTSFTLFGYPGLAILLFMGAAIGGIALMVSILKSDR
jgi:predicted unusual protein kinase regulating ubiquinone biosynthesis (AarF/ABC1/UbiB family)